MAKRHIINDEWLYLYLWKRCFRSLHKGWESVFLSWGPVSKVFYILVGDFRCPPAPLMTISIASVKTTVQQGRRFCICGKVLVPGPPHLCAWGKSLGLPRCRDNDTLWLTCPEKERKHWVQKCSLSISCSTNTCEEEPSFARLWW